jgi:hypothetical protein
VEPDEDGKYEGDEFQMLFVEFDVPDWEVARKTITYLFAAYFVPALNDLSYHLNILESVEVRAHPRCKLHHITCFDFPRHRLPFMCASRYSLSKQATVIRFELYLRKTN